MRNVSLVHKAEKCSRMYGLIRQNSIKQRIKSDEELSACTTYPSKIHEKEMRMKNHSNGTFETCSLYTGEATNICENMKRETQQRNVT